MASGSKRTVAYVLVHGHRVGRMWSMHGTNRFELTREYRELSSQPVFGQVFAKQPSHRWKQAQRLPRWFSNLLPEEDLLRLVVQERALNPRNEFRVLTALGADLPGAVEVIAAGRPATDAIRSEHDRRQLRFSLAGVQLKLSMMWSANTLTLPGKGELGDHLVKLPSRHYDNLIENEYSMMTWARETGIDVPDCEIRRAEDLGPLPRGFGALEGTAVYVVRRFDQGPFGSIEDERIHMEDLNQVVDHWPEAKYKGVSYERLGRIILALCGEGDFLEYVRRLTFCIAIGNEDAHLKNWTIWYPDRINARLSPAYDLVSTIQYKELDRGMALKLNGRKSASLVNLRAMEGLAERTDVDPAQVRQTVQQTLESMRDSWRRINTALPITRNFRDRLGSYQRSVPLVRPFAIE